MMGLVRLEFSTSYTASGWAWFWLQDGGVQRRRGFTIVELMIALTVMAILTVLAFPTISATIAESRLRDALNEIRFDLAEARARATERNVAVVVVLTTPGLVPGGTFRLWESP